MKRDDLWVYAASGRRDTPMWDADLAGGVALVFGAEGKGLRPLVRRACDAAVAIPLAGSGRVARTSASPRPCSSTRRRGSVPDPTLYLFDGFNLLHAGAFADPRELRDRLASFVAMKGARGVVVFDGAGSDEHVGPLEVRFAPTPTRCSSGSPPSTATASSVCLVSSDAAVRGTSGQEVMKLSSRTFVDDLADGRARPSAERGRSPTASTTETRARLERLRRGG